MEVDVDPASEEFKALQALMTGTIAGIHVNTKVNHNVPFTDLVIERAVRIQNPILWVNYHNRTNHVRKKLLEEFGSVDKIPAVKKVLTQGVQTPPSPLDRSINEAFLFHGLNHKFLEEVVAGGFSTRHCSLNGMFGSAVYFAEHSSKANQLGGRNLKNVCSSVAKKGTRTHSRAVWQEGLRALTEVLESCDGFHLFCRLISFQGCSANVWPPRRRACCCVAWRWAIRWSKRTIVAMLLDSFGERCQRLLFERNVMIWEGNCGISSFVQGK